jgi:hypothetical protein
VGQALFGSHARLASWANLADLSGLLPKIFFAPSEKILALIKFRFSVVNNRTSTALKQNLRQTNSLA